MTPEYLRALQAAIMADADCVPHVVTNDMGKVPEAPERDRAIAEILNGKGWGSSSRAVPCHLAKKLLIKHLRWRGIVEAAASADHPARDAAWAAVAMAEDARMEADFRDPDAQPLLQALVDSGLIESTHADALRSMCTVPSSVTGGDVSRALRGPWGDE